MNIRLSAPFRLILAALLVLSLQACATRGTETVSYTHLTLPTIYSV